MRPLAFYLTHAIQLAAVSGFVLAVAKMTGFI